MAGWRKSTKTPLFWSFVFVPLCSWRRSSGSMQTRLVRRVAGRCSRRATRVRDRSVPHERHEQARRGSRDREHDGYCERAQVGPVAPQVGGFRRTGRAAMYSMRGGVGTGTRCHGSGSSSYRATVGRTCPRRILQWKGIARGSLAPHRIIKVPRSSTHNSSHDTGRLRSDQPPPSPDGTMRARSSRDQKRQRHRV